MSEHFLISNFCQKMTAKWRPKFKIHSGTVLHPKLGWNDPFVHKKIFLKTVYTSLLTDYDKSTTSMQNSKTFVQYTYRYKDNVYQYLYIWLGYFVLFSAWHWKNQQSCLWNGSFVQQGPFQDISWIHGKQSLCSVTRLDKLMNKKVACRGECPI